MNNAARIDKIVDERVWSRFNSGLFVLSFLLLLMDGYDLSAIAFAAPHIIKQWGLQQQVFGPVFGAALFGFMFGSPLFGYISDRFGRRGAIFASCASAGILTLGTVFASTLWQLIGLRFMTGIAIGGIIPTVVALNAEFAPRHMRARVIMILASAVTIGAAIPGWLSGWLTVRYGWEALFLVGGLVTVVLSIIAFMLLPESLKYLVEARSSPEKIRVVLHRLGEHEFAARPVEDIGGAAHLRSARSPTQLFTGGRMLVTAMLWVVVVCIQLVYFFISSWMPTVLASAKVPLSNAALITSMFQLGGTIGTLFFALFIDRLGTRGLFLLFSLAIVPTVAIGIATSSFPLLLIAVFGSGFFVLSTITALTAISAVLYPTAIRATGTGWAFGIGRLGAIAGPVLGGILIGLQLEVSELFLLLAVPLSVGAVASLLMQLRPGELKSVRTSSSGAL
jgi:AAHS family 4-hydroxybenzoate transporter-like MFS transporter